MSTTEKHIIPVPPDDLTYEEAAGWSSGWLACLNAIRSLAGTPLDEIETAPARTTDPSTSHRAWTELHADGARGKVALAFYKSQVVYGEKGLTPKGATNRAEIANLSSPWKRVSDLKAAGIIEVVDEILGDRGRMVEVMRLTEYGRCEVERTMPDQAAALRAQIR